MVQKAILIELGGAHSETLYSQLRFLKHGGYHTTLACDPKVMEQVRHLDAVDAFYPCGREIDKAPRFGDLYRLRNYIVSNGIEQVIFNTVQNEAVRNLCMLPFSAQTRFAGTLHNLQKLTGSTTQKIIGRRVKKYFLLAEYLKEKALQIAPARDFEVFYPMFFPDEPSMMEVSTQKECYQIIIPGAVEYSRRDYESIACAFAGLPELPPLEFILLGNAFHKQGQGSEFQKLIQMLGVEKHFRLRDGFVPAQDYYPIVRQADAVMPAVHPGCADYEDYRQRQISGAWNLAFGCHKPLLLESGFCHYPDFEDAGVLCYSVVELPALLASLPQKLEAQRVKKLFSSSRYQFETMAARYLAFLKA